MTRSISLSLFPEHGNLKVAASPSLKLSPDIEVYDPKITDDIKNSIERNIRSENF